MGRAGVSYSDGTFRILLNLIKQLILTRSKLAIYGTFRLMELPTRIRAASLEGQITANYLPAISQSG